MNKKFILSISLILLVGLTVFVSADVPYDTVKNDMVTAKDIVYGSSSDLPFIRSSFQIHKGWNLIPVSGNGIQSPARSPDNYFGYTGEMGCGNKKNDFSGYQIKYGYAYIPNKGYIGGKIDYNSGGFEGSVQTEYENAVKDFYFSQEMGGNDGIWSLYLTSKWVYSEMDCEYPLAGLDLRDVSKYSENLAKTKLNQGWNLIFIYPTMYDKKFGDSIGNCKVVAVNQWNPVSQAWQYTSEESKQQVDVLLNSKVNLKNLYFPLVIKVEDTCTLGQSVTIPPVIPN